MGSAEPRDCRGGTTIGIKPDDQALMLLAAIVGSSDDAIISETLDGVVTSWNPAAERMFGYGADEMIGRPLARTIPTDLLDRETSLLRRLARGERIDHYETARLQKGGR